MNDTLFTNDFIFTEFYFNTFRHNDISQGTEHHYIAYMREGYCNIIAGKDSFTVNEGEFFYLPQHFRYHSYWNVGNNGVVRFDSYAFKSMPLQHNIIYQPQSISPFHAANEINEKLARDKNIGFQSVGLFYQLFGLLVEKMICMPKERKNSIVQRAEEYMRDNIHAKAPDIAKHCGISQTGLYEAFKLVRDYTPVVAKHKIIVEMAREMLTTTNMSVEEISTALGFGNAAYFRKIFFNATQQTPREFRKKTII